LADPHSVKFYMRVLWRVVEGKIPATAVYNAYRAAYCTHPGAEGWRPGHAKAWGLIHYLAASNGVL
jgi:hypothetical protein